MKEQLHPQEAERESLPPPHRRLGMRVLELLAAMVPVVGPNRAKREDADLPDHLADPIGVGISRIIGRQITASPSAIRLTAADVARLSNEDKQLLRAYVTRNDPDALRARFD